jgi:manganese/zinc/iron transport system permease protein
MSPRTEIALVMAAVAAACAVPGTFLVLRRLAMTADAIGHTLLLGIVVAFAVVGDLSSPWLAAGAAGAGVLTVVLIDVVRRSPKVKQDAAIGLVFPALFALGTILTSMEFRDIHLDVDAVLLGQVESSWLTRTRFAGLDVPRSFAVMAGFAVANALLVGVFYKELKLTTFDAGLAMTLGFLPTVVHLALVCVVSLTAVAAFDAVGPVLVVAFFVVPPATAQFLTHRLGTMIVLSAFVGIVGAVAGTFVAFALDTNVAGTVATLLGLIFGVTAIAARTPRSRAVS